MANPSKKKGSAWEVALLPSLRQWWPYAERRPPQGAQDKGDFLAGRWTISAKNHARGFQPVWVDEAAVMAGRNGGGPYCVIHKRRGVGDPKRALVTMPLSVFIAQTKP